MIKHKVIELRTFDECSPELKKKILDKYRNFETENDWIVDMVCDYTSDMLKKEYGFKCTEKDICYDMSCCQGSGASFTCDDFDWNKILEGLDIKHKKWWCEYLDSCGMTIVSNNSHYCHRMTKHWDTGDCMLDYTFSDKWYPHLTQEFERILEYIEDIRIKACNKMYKAVQDEYNYYKSMNICDRYSLTKNYYSMKKEKLIMNDEIRKLSKKIKHTVCPECKLDVSCDGCPVTELFDMCKKEKRTLISKQQFEYLCDVGVVSCYPNLFDLVTYPDGMTHCSLLKGDMKEDLLKDTPWSILFDTESHVSPDTRVDWAIPDWLFMENQKAVLKAYFRRTEE